MGKKIQLVKPKTKSHQTLTSDKYTYGEMLHITNDISNTTFRKKDKICKEIKIKRIKGCTAEEALADT